MRAAANLRAAARWNTQELMRQLQPVIWSKGVFLSPQHLQAQDRFSQDTLRFYLESLCFCPWGFLSLQINREALADGQFAISSASGFFPDGLAFDIPGTEPAPSPLNLADYFLGERRALDLYLSVPCQRERSANLSLNSNGGGTRYVLQEVPVRDENTGQLKRIALARKNLRFLPEGDLQVAGSALRIARIERCGASSFRVDPRLVPPLVDLGASDNIVGMLRGLVELLSGRSRELSEIRSQKNERLANFTASDVPNFWLLYTVNAYFPLLRHFLQNRRGHPADLFSVLLALAGSLTAFSKKVRPSDLAEYNHNDLGACLADLEDKIRILLEEVPPNFEALPLRLFKPGIYSSTFSEDKYLLDTKMYLALSAAIDQAELITKVPQLVKVSSATEIESLITQALPGISLSHQATPPVPLKLKYQYFRVDQSGRRWSAVERARSFAVYVPSDFVNPELELVVVFPERR